MILQATLSSKGDAFEPTVLPRQVSVPLLLRTLGLTAALLSGA